MALSVFSVFPGYWFAFAFIILGVILFVILLLCLFRDSYSLGPEEAVGFGFGALFISGFVLLIGWGVQSQAHYSAQTLAFETFYEVAIVSEDGIPQGQNQQKAVTLFLKDAGPTACIVSTDDVEYTVSCNGEELLPAGS